MNAEQMDMLDFINGKANAFFRDMDVYVRRIKARQSGSEIVVTIEFVDGSTKYFNASGMTKKQAGLQIYRRV